MKFWALGLLLLCGCCDQPTDPPKNLIVKGVLKNITMCQEDSAYTVLLIEFEDGQIVKCRAVFRDPLQFKRGQTNILTIRRGNALLEKVEFLAENANQIPENVSRK